MKNFTHAFFTTKSKLTSLVLLVFFALMLVPELATAQPWTYNFGTGTGSHTSTTASTVFLPATVATPASGLTRVRCGTNPGSFTLANPGLAGLGTDTEMQFTGNTSSTSTSKMSIYDYTAAKVGYVKFNIAFTGGTNGVFRFSLGNGASFSDSNGIGVTQTFAAIQWTKTSATAISYAFLNSSNTFVTTGLSNPTTTFTQTSTPVYLVEVYANNESTSQGYTRSGANTLAAGTWDLWVDGTKVGSNLAKAGLPANANFDSFAFNTQSSVTAPGSIYLDDLEYSNAFPASATITPSPTTLTGITYVEGSGPSTASSFTIAASNLSAGPADITFTESTDYEVSTTSPGTSGFGASVTLPYTGTGTLANNTVWVRLKAGRTAGAYNSQTIGISGGGASSSVTVSGSVTSAAAPTITGAATATAFTTTYGTASTEQSFAVSGVNLTTDLVATAPTGYEVSNDGVTYASTATFTQTSGNASGTLRIRLTALANVVGTSYNSQNIVLSSTGATSVNIATAASGNAVSAKALGITGTSIANKVYNASAVSGAVTPGTLTGLVGAQTLNVSATGLYGDANAGIGKTATITYTLTNGTGIATNYSLAGTATGDITQATAVITFGALAAKTTADAPFALTATSTSGNTVTYISGTPATATIAGSTVTILAAGSTVITASDAGNANYAAATDVLQTLTVTAGPIWSNVITAANPSATNPFVTGDAVVANLAVSGITRAAALTASSASNRFSATTWPTAASVDLTKYFEFTLTPDPGYEIDFTNFIYTGQTTSAATPSVEVRSSDDSYGSVIATPSVTGSTVNLSAFQNITTAITFRIYYFGLSNVGNTLSINDFQFNGEVVLGTPVPEMNVTQGGSIASGGTNAFGNQENGTSGSAVTFTIQNTGNAVLNLSGTPKVAITGDTADFVINQVATTATLAATSGTTTFTVTFTPQAVGSRAAQLSIANDDGNENPYLINLTGTGTTSQNSSISAATFTAPTNIAYGSYQAGNITSVNSLEVGKFTLQDGVSDNDSFGTTLSTITLSLSNFANVQRVALYDGSTELQEIAAGATNTFNAGLGAITTASGGTKDFSIRVTFNGTVTDNQQFQFTVTGATADVAGSGFAAANAGGANTSIAGDNNRIEVTANRLTFGTVGGGSINVTLPSFTLSATDGLLNVDLDRSAAVILGTTSVFSSANFTRTTPDYALTGGSITISDVAFADAQTTTLTADAAGLTQGASNPFIISLVSFPANSYRTTSAGAYPSGATWERFVSGTWTSGFTPIAGEDDFIYIRHAITNASNSPQNVVIETGGTFTYNSSATNLTSLLVESGGILQINAALTVSGTFTVESGGTVNVNNSTTNGASALWNGVEDFQDGSTVNIQNWQYADSNRLIENPSNISVNTTSSNYFGNLIVSGSPSSLFVIVDGSPTINLCKNDLTVSENGTNNVAITNFGANATIGGDIIVTTGQLSIAATTSGNPVTTVLGNISVASGGTLNLNQSSSGSATSNVQLKGNFSVVSGGTFNSNDAGCNLVFSGTTGTQTLSLAGTLGTNANFEVGDGTNASTVQLINQNLNLTNSSNAFTVKTNGILDFNYRDITGIGTFTLESAGELRITSAAGLTASGATGNVTSSGTRTISQSGIFHYTGNVTPQATGTAMTSGSTAKRIIIDKTNPTDVVNLTQSTGTTDQLEIIEGTLVETAAANITGSGDLLMSGGTYRTAVLATTLPQLSGSYTLTGGTIDLNGAGDQVLRGARDYSNLTFSTSGTKTTTSGISTIDGLVTIKDAAIVNVGNSTFGGSGTDLTMTGTARYITDGSGTKPDAEGAYALGANTTIEFANNSACIIRLGLIPISYAKVEVSGTNVSSTSTTTGILFQAGGSFTVKQGATFTFRQPGGLNGLVNSAVSSTNNPTVTLENSPSLSTIVYNGIGQTLTGRADYGNLTIDNTSGALTTSGDVTVSGTLTLTKGIVTTGANTIAVTNDTTPISGGSNTAYISGKLRFTYPAIGTDVARTFPIGKGGAYRPLVFSYDTAPASRTVLVEQFEGAFPSAFPSTATPFGARYWNITQSSTGVSYKATLNTTTATSSIVVMVRREGTGASTSNETTGPNYTNIVSFATTNVSNDLALGTCLGCTQLRPMHCGKTLSALNTVIQASPVTGATQYRFEVIRTDDPLDTRTITSNNYYFNPVSYGGFIYGKSYTVRVALFIGSWLQYGPVCIITAPTEPVPSTTQIRASQCGATLSSIAIQVEATPVYQATQYEFEVTSDAGTFIAPSNNYYFSLYYSVPGRALYGTPYSIRVRSKGALTPFSAWGAACIVTTPSAPISRMSDTNEMESIFYVKAFPNPFASHFSLDIESSSDDVVEMKVFDMIGRQLEANQATVSELSTREIGRNYPSGVYNVIVSQGNKVKSVRMIKR